MDLPPDAAELRAIWNKGRPDPSLAKGIGGRVLDGLEADRHWVARLNAARLASLLEWSPNEREAVVERLLALRDDPNRFVRPWALGALWRMVAPNDPRRKSVEAWMDEAIASGSAAERARARILLAEDARSRTRNGKEAEPSSESPDEGSASDHTPAA